MTQQQTVLLTDRAWPDDGIEREILEKAGYRVISGPADPAPVETIDALVAEHQPAAILTCWAAVSADAIASSVPLRIVARMGVGLDNIAVSAATNRGVQVTNVPDYCVAEVSDHAVGLALAWTRGLVTADREVRAGKWNPAGARLRRLSTLTCGVIGYGRIGRATAAKLRALEARVVISDPNAPADTDGMEVLALDDLLASCDVVILHAPLVPQTHHLIGQRELALLPRDAFIINVSRGGLVDTAALLASLNSGHLGGAGLDVLEEEPVVPEELLAHPGVVVTPHIAFASDASVIDLRRSAAEEVVRVLRGEPARYPCNTPSPLTTGVSF
ncbi:MULTISPECIES: C-terminal binding protein [Paenarthrobacter]|uniref:C-terminal binding protein n=1 Tax=Paenarthrobacter TaxID=1742992 RepID=UPI00074D366D|nr:C-terminal binding protein [Paenarthrobacter ureafaciens]AMB40323.1 phosphoglycerate dehydrogenase [Arthrobacter sp. ATCC 21022]KUR63528.1 phosphoglycerate dehydrogenase [Arthrobacter sp. ATCC 21022]RWW91484.1 C-terminal binding protein [Paenarthrobacter ureafaciens]